MQFKPVLPVSLNEDWNLINRPVIPIYQSVLAAEAPPTNRRRSAVERYATQGRDFAISLSTQGNSREYGLVDSPGTKLAL